MMGTGMVIDPNDVEYCEKHECNYIAGDECDKCALEAYDLGRLKDRMGVLESFLRSVVHDGGASKNLRDCARQLLTTGE